MPPDPLPLPTHSSEHEGSAGLLVFTAGVLACAGVSLLVREPKPAPRARAATMMMALMALLVRFLTFMGAPRASDSVT